MTTLNVLVNSNIDNILIDNPTIDTFIFEPGMYYLTKILKITRPNVNFTGTTNAKDIHIFQTNVNQDGINVISHFFYMSNISVHVEHPAYVALIVANAHNSIIENCYFYGNPTTFTVYYAGPSVNAGIDTINAYNNNNLDKSNIFRNNVVYSKWSGDSVSFSLQLNGTFFKNIIRGGKVAVYMCKRTTIRNNVIYDSTSHGVYLSLPSHNVTINKNKIYECANSAIIIKDQVEHGVFVPTPYNINISENFLYDAKFNGIEANNLITATLNNNKLLSSDNNGFYFLNCSDVRIISNTIAYFNVAFWLENTNNCTIDNNSVYSVYPSYGNNVVKFVNSIDNTVSNSNINGTMATNTFYGGNTVNNNTISNDIYNQYYSYNNELSIMKFGL